MADHLLTGTHVVEAVCPRCGQLEAIAIGLSSVLTVPTDDRPSLRVKLKSKPIDHDCRQARLPLMGDGIDTNQAEMTGMADRHAVVHVRRWPAVGVAFVLALAWAVIVGLVVAAFVWGPL